MNNIAYKNNKTADKQLGEGLSNCTVLIFNLLTSHGSQTVSSFGFRSEAGKHSD